MWRPVALSAFLALLFITTRSGQMPPHGEGEAAVKSDLLTLDDSATDLRISARAPEQSTPHIINSYQWSEHPKTSSRSRAEPPESPRDQRQQVASAAIIPPPQPKVQPGDAEMQIIVSATEERTALETTDDSLSLMPPGPDFPARVQTELARLGCYNGRVDNIWGPMSRRAVRDFSDKASLGLQREEPTRALLVRLREAPDGFCTSECAAPGSASCTAIAALAPEERPDYLPPWMRGEPMPSRQAEVEKPVSVASATPQAGTVPATQPSVAARPEPQASAFDAREAARQQRRERREARRNRQAFKPQNFDFAWPGQ